MECYFGSQLDNKLFNFGKLGTPKEGITTENYTPK